jgi:hypothetical protein
MDHRTADRPNHDHAMPAQAVTAHAMPSQAMPTHAMPRRQARPSAARRRLRLYTRGIPVLLSIGAVMTLGASPAGEFLGPEAAQAARTTANASPAADCQIKGSTYVDENANGRFDDQENGLSGAVLSIRGRTNWFHATADRSGRFAVAGLPAGIVVITIDSPRAAERFGPARRTVTVGTKCVSLDAIALVPEQTEFASFG